MRVSSTAAVFVGSLLLSVNAFAVEYQGIEFPRGEASFADSVVSLSYDDQTGVEAPYDDGAQALGPPDASDEEGWVSLGNALDEQTINELVVSFDDNRLVNVEGDDLYIFEIGPQVEATTVAISEDGETWVELGRVEGSTRALDLADFDVPSGAEFQFVRLRDFPDGESSGSPFAGPDIDAIGAIGSIVTEGSPICRRPESTPAEYASIRFPHGELSFADQVVDYVPGAEVEEEYLDPTRTLGPPDETATALGVESEDADAGTITVFFRDNALTDEAGPDLYIFEIGPQTEATFVEVSSDGETWHDLGRVAGSTSAIDLAEVEGLPERALYRFVRLSTDPDEQKSGAPFAGPDIDAVGAISSCEPVSTVDEDDDGVPDSVEEGEGGASVPSDFDGDGTPDAVDACPADPDVAEEGPASDGQECSWGGAAEDDDLNIDLSEGCGCASSSNSSPASLGLLLFGLVALRWRRRRM